MAKVIKHIDSSGNVDFEFSGCEYWEDFDIILSIINKNMNATIIDIIEGIYSKEATLKMKNIETKLRYHEDTGNSIFPVNQSEENLKLIGDLSEIIVAHIEKAIN